MALSGNITFGLLVILIDCLNGQITNSNTVIIKASTRAARIEWKVESSTLQSGVLHLYKAPPKGALQRLMYFEGSKINKDPDTPRRYSGSVSGDKVTLTISKLERSDEGSYYCTLWSGDKKVFGSGTRLYVTAQGTFNLPTLYGYVPSKKNMAENDKQTMLCQASDMFPDLVTFKWKKRDAGDWKDISEGDVVEQRNESPKVTVTSMLIVDKAKAQTDSFQCTVIHEGNSANPQTLEMKKENSEPVVKSEDEGQNPTCPPTEEPITKQISGDSEQIPSMFLFVYAYDLLLMKNGLFFCVVSIFLLKRKAGRKDKSSET